MRLSWRDGLATVFVGAVGVVYALWLAGTEMAGPRLLAGVVLGLGLAASVTAVVYGVGVGLLHASKAYLAVASLLGLAALVAGVIALVSANQTMLATLVASTVALWMISTIRHAVATPTERDHQAATGEPLEKPPEDEQAAQMRHKRANAPGASRPGR